MKSPEILILGSGGLVGNYLLDQIKDEEKTIICTYRERKPDQGKYANIEFIKWNSHESGLPKDLNGIECVVHLANNIYPGGCLKRGEQDKPIEMIETNSKVIKWCNLHKPKKLIWIGSSLGYSAEINASENNYQSGTPQNKVLGYINRAFESQLRALAETNNIDIRIFVPSTILGKKKFYKRGREHNAIKLLESLVSRKEINIFRPELKRDYIYAMDVGKLLREEMMNPHMSNGVHICNLLSGKTYSNTDIVRLAESMWNLEEVNINIIKTEDKPNIVELIKTENINRYKTILRPLGEFMVDLGVRYNKEIREE